MARNRESEQYDAVVAENRRLRQQVAELQRGKDAMNLGNAVGRMISRDFKSPSKFLPWLDEQIKAKRTDGALTPPWSPGNGANAAERALALMSEPEPDFEASYDGFEERSDA